jgi:histidine kinase
LLYPKFRESLNSAIGDEGALLASLAPALSNLLGFDTESEKFPTSTDEVYTTRINRLHYVVRQLFKVLCTADHPLILILDDMQWCDSSSLSLLSSIVTDGRLSHLLVVTTCREDETTRPYLDLLASCWEEHHITVKSIQLRNLDQSAVLSMVSTALRSSEEKTFQLSEIVHQKSNGNPLYVLQFLTRLYEDGLLKYNLGLMHWTWEETRVRTRFVMDNVADLTSAKLQNLPIQCQTILQIASCLGQTFDMDHLEFVMQEPRVQQIYAVVEGCWPLDLSASLNHLVGEGIVDFIPELVCYCFVHDLIQDAAFRLIPESDKLRVQLEVGRRLLRSPESLHSHRFSEMYLFRAVELSNAGAHLLGEDETLGLAKHNLDAGQRAMAKAAFASALKYMEEGLLRLGPGSWENQPHLTLDLASGAVEASYCCGDFTSMEKHMESVLKRGIPIHDKVRCYLTRILSYGAQDLNADALETGRDVLIKMKITTLPKCPGKHHVRVELAKTKLLLRGHTLTSLVALPLLKDKHWHQAMGIIDMMNAIAYCANINFFTVMNLRMLRWTIKQGVCRFSPTVFSTYGVVLCGLGELQLAHMFGELREPRPT